MSSRRPDDTIALHLEYLHDRNLSAAYIRQREQVLRRLSAELPCLPIGATDDHVTAAARRRSRALSPASWAVELAHWRGYFRWARKRGLRSDDPTEELELPKLPKRLPRPIPDSPFAAALAKADPEARVILLLGFDCGMRRAEIAALTWDGVDLDAAPPTARFVGKGDKERVVPLTPDAVDALVALPHRRGPVIRSRNTGQALTPSALAERVRPLLGRHTMHALRHSAGTRFTRHGGIRVAQELLGHESPNTTALYAKVDPADMAAVVEASSWSRRRAS